MKNSSTKWNSIIIHTHSRYFEQIIGFLIELGAEGAVENEEEVQAYFSNEPFLEKILKETEIFLQDVTGREFSIEIKTVKNENWMESWKKYYRPIQLTNDLLILPSWYNDKEYCSKYIIKLDPGMAFGAGSHETTQISLLLLEKYLQPSSSVLDIGSGTGILSIFAAYKSNGKITSVEIDKDAEEYLRKNISLNNVQDKIEIIISDIKDYSKDNPADLIILNIEERILRMIFPYVLRYLKNSGIIIITGILETDFKKFSKSLESWNLRIVETMSRGEWIGCVCRLNEKQKSSLSS